MVTTARNTHLQTVRDSPVHVEEDPDFQLLQRWVEGDRRAGDRLVKHYYLNVTRFFMNAVDDPDRAELTQETFSRLCTAAGRFSGESSFRSYLFGIARNVLNEFLRRRYRRRKHEVDSEFNPQEHTIVDAGQRTPSRLLSELVRRDVMLQCLRELPVDDKQMMEMYYWQGLTASEVGEAYGMVATTVRTRLHYVRKRLAVAIAEREPSLGNVDLDTQVEALRRLMGFGPTKIDVEDSAD